MKRTSKRERLAHIENWRSSGLSRPAYSREQGLKYSTFLSWFKDEIAEAKPGKFVALGPSGNERAGVSIIFPQWHPPGIRGWY
jgi:hypothetical protein